MTITSTDGAGGVTSPATLQYGTATGNAVARTGDHSGNAIHVVEFLLGKEHYAVNLTDVREVVVYTAITPLPNSPAIVQGIIDLRGEITTILDLRQRLNIAARETKKETSRIMVLDDKITRVKTGVLVDDVLSVSTFEKSEVDTNLEGATWGESAILGTIRRKTKEQDKEKTDLIIWIDIRELTRGLDGKRKET
jgi:purine-binding chemotaxis protein CheW